MALMHANSVDNKTIRKLSFVDKNHFVSSFSYVLFPHCVWSYMNKTAWCVRRIADVIKCPGIPGLLLIYRVSVANPLTFYLIRVFSSVTLRY